MLVVLLTITALLVPAAPRSGPFDQNKSAVDQWIQHSYEATQRYRSGDLTGALKLLGSMAKDEQEKAVGAIRAQMERIAAGWPPRPTDVVPWTPRLLRSLAALHMEAALVARNSMYPGLPMDRDAVSVADHHLALATNAFGAAAALTGEQDPFAAQWILAIGLQRMAQAEFTDAYHILTPHCHEKQTYAPLFVACGTLHETFASLAGEPLLRVFRTLGPEVGARRIEPGGTLSWTVRQLSSARFARKQMLERAREYLERALRLDSSNIEGILRLAQVRMQQKDDGAAAELFEKLIARSLDARERYLARLFLARIRDRQNRLADAAALLAETATHQSSLIARAHNAQRRGDAREAAGYVERAALLGVEDPWWGYRYGQYWLPEELLKALREEARK